MKKVIICSTNDDLQATILPAFGAMVSELNFRGVETLRMNYAMLGISNVLSGGIPVLFPFAGKSVNDTVRFKGDEYTMPMHGFAKDMPFEVLCVRENQCELCLDSDSIITKNFYPYNFRLSIAYEVEDGVLTTTAKVENRSDAIMPLAIGFHPFFKTHERTALTLDFDLNEYWDYTRCDESGNPAHGFREEAINPSGSYDHVFKGDCGVKATLINREAGYRAQLSADETFKVLTLCNTLENATCIEPWQSTPDAANTGELLQAIQKDETASFSYRIVLSLID